jgi:hypothetical protein
MGRVPLVLSADLAAQQGQVYARALMQSLHWQSLVIRCGLYFFRYYLCVF